ncbi:hypothetical protein M0R45_026500 [Rubus argutus]|uniref:Uncharacterized protein n=1 Tax=Rubus argutus TaxID=59490 RepID=A0AAW1X0A7_RUBAR
MATSKPQNRTHFSPTRPHLNSPKPANSHSNYPNHHTRAHPLPPCLCLCHAVLRSITTITASQPRRKQSPTTMAPLSTFAGNTNQKPATRVRHLPYQTSTHFITMTNQTCNHQVLQQTRASHKSQTHASLNHRRRPTNPDAVDTATMCTTHLFRDLVATASIHSASTLLCVPRPAPLFHHRRTSCAASLRARSSNHRPLLP